MNGNGLKQIYVKIPSRIYGEMLEYGLMDKSLDVWFVSMVLDEIEHRKLEIIKDAN